MSYRVLTRRLSLLSFAVAVGLLAAGVCGTGHAAPLWYDGFDLAEYTADAVLDGQSGGSGPGTPFFTNPWVAAGYPGLSFQTRVIAEGLSRPGLTEPTVGGSASHYPTPEEACQYDYGGGTGGCYESRTSRLMTEPWSAFTNPDGTFFVGFLVDFTSDLSMDNAADPHHRAFEMHVDGLDDFQRNLTFGVSSFLPEHGGPTLALAVRDSSLPEPNITGQKLVVDGHLVGLAGLEGQGTHWMVLKFEMSNSVDDVISAYLDPVGMTEPAPNAQIPVGEFLADRMSALVQFTYDYQRRGFFDELRVGTEWADVAVNTLPYVPEPASGTLLALGMLGALLAGRRKRS